MSNITQVVNSEKIMTTFKKGISSAGLGQLVSGRGPYTVFAPSDLAFKNLSAGTIEDLLKPASKVKLTTLLNHYVVHGKIRFQRPERWL